MTSRVTFFLHGKTNLAISYFETKNFKVVSKSCDPKEQIPILHAVLNDTNLLLINFYNSNSEPYQICTFSTLQKLLEKVNDFNKKSIIFGADFNLTFASKYDALGGNQALKKDY